MNSGYHGILIVYFCTNQTDQIVQKVRQTHLPPSEWVHYSVERPVPSHPPSPKKMPIPIFQGLVARGERTLLLSTHHPLPLPRKPKLLDFFLPRPQPPPPEYAVKCIFLTGWATSPAIRRMTHHRAVSGGWEISSSSNR